MDRELQQLLAQNRRDEAFAVLLKLYQNKIFRLMFSMVGNVARAEETTQDVFLKIWQALPRFDGRASLSTWIYTIARNTAISHLRAEAHRKSSPLEEAPEPCARNQPVLSEVEVTA
jgi:RNA polymerase sigma-70 factor (ECF subfamily)